VNLEDALAEYQQKADAVDLVELSAFRFYVRKVIGQTAPKWLQSVQGGTNLLQLAHRIERWRRHNAHPAVTYVTFNYDLLMEEAFRQLGIASVGADIDGLVSGDRARLVKVHGSVDWFRLIPDRGSDNELRSMIDEFNHIAPRVAEAPYLRFGDGRDEMFRYQGNLLYPAISVPVANKDAFECPASHLDVARRALWEANLVLIIGWRAADTRFLAEWSQWRNFPLDRRPWQNFLVVTHSAEESQDVFRRIRTALDESGVSAEDPQSTGFSDFLRTAALEKFLG
jgi:hypothetical protein